MLILLLIGFAVGCSTNNDKYNYIKVLSIIKADSITDYNKGFTLGDFLYYDPQTDSVTFRILQSRDPYKFLTYKGKLSKKAYADTIEMLIAFQEKPDTKHSEDTNHCYQPTCYCAPYFYVEYNDRKGSKFLSLLDIYGDTLDSFIEFFYRLKELPWGKKLVSDKEIDKTEVVVNMLKGYGIYDSIVKTYVPLPCDKGIDFKKLNGTWRTIGDEYNDATLNYMINKIDTAGNWIIDRVDRWKITRRYTGRIKSIREKIIEVESEQGITTLEILNLTENCFEYRVKEAEQTWRLDRLK